MFYDSLGIEGTFSLAPGRQQSVTSTCSTTIEGRKISLRRFQGPCRWREGDVSYVTAEGQFPVPGSDLEMLFKVPVREVWLIWVEEHVGLAMSCPPGLSLPSSTGMGH